MTEELKKLQGKWELLELKKDGVLARAGDIEETLIEFTDHCYVETAQGHESFGRITIRSGSKFRQMEAVISLNCACEKRLYGIYVLEEDLLKVCFSEDKTFPDILDSSSGSGCIYRVWKRSG